MTNTVNRNTSDRNSDASEDISNVLIALGLLALGGGIFFGYAAIAKAGALSMATGGAIKIANRWDNEEDSERRIA
ncbi:MAG: hypothetical protein MUC87_22045 [Bacteroidia bacterium]|jgi:hypothetical protein|nr:hypothetical protein [Bacteroidia bacterium]